MVKGLFLLLDHTVCIEKKRESTASTFITSIKEKETYRLYYMIVGQFYDNITLKICNHRIYFLNTFSLVSLLLTLNDEILPATAIYEVIYDIPSTAGIKCSINYYLLEKKNATYEWFEKVHSDLAHSKQEYRSHEYLSYVHKICSGARFCG